MLLPVTVMGTSVSVGLTDDDTKRRDEDVQDGDTDDDSCWDTAVFPNGAGAKAAEGTAAWAMKMMRAVSFMVEVRLKI